MAWTRVTKLLAAGLLAVAPLAHGQGANYPSKPIKLIVAYSPGGGADAVARLTAQFLSNSIRQAIVVENRPGADGRVGAEAVAKAPADGFTLLLAPDNLFTVVPHLIPNATINGFRDLEPVAPVAHTPLVIAAGTALSISTVADLVRVAKARPGSLSYGSSGNASLHRMAGENLCSLAGIELVHVPYKGTSAGAQDLAGGQIQLLFGQLPSIQ